MDSCNSTCKRFPENFAQLNLNVVDYNKSRKCSRIISPTYTHSYTHFEGTWITQWMEKDKKKKLISTPNIPFENNNFIMFAERISRAEANAWILLGENLRVLMIWNYQTNMTMLILNAIKTIPIQSRCYNEGVWAS